MSEWRDIPGHPGYQASPLGLIRSTRRILKPQACSNGYRQVSLGAKNVRRVHRLIAITFLEGDGSLQVNHKNGDRSDNRLQNLEWATCSENHLHSYRELPRKKHGLTRKVRLYKGAYYEEFDSGVEAANYLGVVPGSVASAATKAHKCRGFEVVYV